MQDNAYHAARMVALHSALLALLIEFSEDAQADTIHARLFMADASVPRDFPTFDLHYTLKDVPVGGEGM